VTFSNEGSVKSVLLHKHHEINGEIMLVSKAYSGQQWKQWQLEKEINEVRMLKSQGIVHADDKKGTQIIVKIPNTFKDCIDTKKLEEYFSIYGETEETLMLRNKSMVTKGIGFVAFKESNVAENVLAHKNHRIGNAEFYVTKSLTADKKALNTPKDQQPEYSEGQQPPYKNAMLNENCKAALENSTAA